VTIRAICVIHLNQIGDLVFSLPLLYALRENFPDAVIHCVVKPYLRGLLEHSPYVDAVLLRTSGLRERVRLIREIRRSRYDMLISLSESEECLLLTALSNARLKAGFSRFPWDAALHIKERVEGHHGWYNNRKLLRKLNVRIVKDDYVGLLHFSQDRPVSGEDPGRPVLPDRCVIIAPGTSPRRRMKAWANGKFADVAIQLHRRYGLHPVLVGGADNRVVNARIAEMIKVNAADGIQIVDATDEVDLPGLCRVISHAELYVGIDSGLMHLAAALDIPVVGIFGPTDPFFVGPQNSRSIVVRKEDLPCVPCYLKGCPDRECLANLSADAVMDACERLLGSSTMRSDAKD